MGLYAGKKKLKVMLNGKAYKLHAPQEAARKLTLERPTKEDQNKESSMKEQTE